MKCLLNEKYTVLLKEVRGKKKWKDIRCLLIERINIVKMVIDLNIENRFIDIGQHLEFQFHPFQILMEFFTEIETKSQICMDHKRPWIAKVILRKNKVGDSHHLI